MASSRWLLSQRAPPWMLLPAVNSFHKKLHLEGCSSPRSASGSSVSNIRSSLFLYFSKKTPAQVMREIATEPETDEESDNELHFPEVNNNIAASLTQPDQLDTHQKVQKQSRNLVPSRRKLCKTQKETWGNVRASDVSGLQKW